MIVARLFRHDNKKQAKDCKDPEREQIAIVLLRIILLMLVLSAGIE